MRNVVTIETAELGDRSYLVHDGHVALVVDPQRDIDRILAAADWAGVRISLVAETHIHNDYVSGGLELSRSLGIPYLVAAAEKVAFDRVPVAGGQQIDLGSLHIRAIASPGHTPHHLSYLVTSPDGQPALFSGGSLLYGTVGRTDLIAAGRTEELTRAQHRSARRLAAHLDDDVALWPTHGFGSFCSSGTSSGAVSSTIGSERRSNPALTLDDEDAFVDGLLGGLTAYPKYYAHMDPINRSGPTPLHLRPPHVLDPEQLRARLDAGAWVVDLAERQVFARGHLRGSISVSLGNQFATYLGWVLPSGAPLVLVADTPEQVALAQRSLARIGVEGIGEAAVGPRAVLAGRQPLASYPVSSFVRLQAALAADPTTVILDVRREDERAAGAIEGSLHLPLQLTARMSELPRATLWVHCAGGFRASIAASLLAQAGRDPVLVDDDWSNAALAGLPMAGGGDPVCVPVGVN